MCEVAYINRTKKFFNSVLVGSEPKFIMFKVILFTVLSILLTAKVGVCDDRITISQLLSFLDKIAVNYQEIRESIPKPNNINPFKYRQVYETPDVRPLYESLPQSIKGLLVQYTPVTTTTSTSPAPSSSTSETPQTTPTQSTSESSTSSSPTTLPPFTSPPSSSTASSSSSSETSSSEPSSSQSSSSEPSSSEPSSSESSSSEPSSSEPSSSESSSSEPSSSSSSSSSITTESTSSSSQTTSSSSSTESEATSSSSAITSVSTPVSPETTTSSSTERPTTVIAESSSQNIPTELPQAIVTTRLRRSVFWNSDTISDDFIIDTTDLGSWFLNNDKASSNKRKSNRKRNTSDTDKLTEVINDFNKLASTWGPGFRLYKAKLRLFESMLYNNYPSNFFERAKALLLAKPVLIARPFIRLRTGKVLSKARRYRAELQDPQTMDNIIVLLEAVMKLPDLLIKSLIG